MHGKQKKKKKQKTILSIVSEGNKTYHHAWD